MKLRRAMVTAAATAAIAPLALLSAPTAFAEGEIPEPTPSVSVPATEDDSTPAATPSTEAPAPSEETEAVTPSPTVTTPGTTAPSPSADPSPSATDGEGEDGEDGDGAADGDGTEEPAPFCEELDEEYANAVVAADLSGLPGKIVAGSGFHNFSLKVTNDSDRELRGVALYAEVENFEWEDADKFLSRYVDLQFKNPDTGKWERIWNEEAEYAGDYFLYAEKLKAHGTLQVPLRVSIAANAPAGDAYSFGSGAYLDNIDGQDCVAEGNAFYEFQVLEAGAANPSPGEAEPDKGKGKGKGNAPKPQGELSELPGGSLAETGSSSMLPTVALVGGLAVVAGAGAVYTVRRRKAGAAV